MSERSAEFVERLQALRDAYSAQLPGKIDELRQLWEAQRLKPSVDGLRTLHRLVHSLSGSGATFGYNDVSLRARELEVYLKTVLSRGGALDASDIAFIETRLVPLCALVIAAPAPPREDAALLTALLPDVSHSRLLFVVGSADDPGGALAQQLQHFGYEVRAFEDVAGAHAALAEQPPAALIMDVVTATGDLIGVREVAKLKVHGGLPVVFVSLRDDLPARLAAVRAQGDGYFVKPVDIIRLIDTLDSLTLHRPREAYRVLIVDDDVALCNHYALVLQQVDMEVRVVDQPLAIMEVLHEFRPDLILMDVNMPDCDGLDLAAVLRQQPDFVGTPIVFLSTDVDAELHKKAIRLGGEDFLIKPVLTDRLLASVSSRVQRARILRSYMVRDSLTGLLNHSTLQDNLAREYVRTRRHGKRMCYALLDLDHFKMVNDRHGHAAGDRVLKTLARMLLQRLRLSDIVGRVGGEEFAVIFTDTGADHAHRIMDEIREAFAEVVHRGDAGEFRVTFSCGVAAQARHPDAAAINRAADQALYEAKRSGRNRVLLAEDSNDAR